jgi:hypothetical protein
MTMDIEYVDIDDIPDTIDIQRYMYEPLPLTNVLESSEESDFSDESDQRGRRLNTFWLVDILV